MIGEHFRRVTLEDMVGGYFELSDAMEDRESLPPTSNEENTDKTMVDCSPTMYTSDGVGCTIQSSPQ